MCGRRLVLGEDASSVSAVHSGTALFAIITYISAMQPERTKTMLVGLWVLAISAAIVLVNLSLPTSTVLACLAVVPPIVMLRWWKDRHQTMSQTIQEALR